MGKAIKFSLILLIFNIFGCIRITEREIVKNFRFFLNIGQEEITIMNGLNNAIENMEKAYKTKNLEQYLLLFSTMGIVNNSNYFNFQKQVTQLFSQYLTLDLKILPTFIYIQLPAINKNLENEKIPFNAIMKEENKKLELKGELTRSNNNYEGVLSGIYLITDESRNKTSMNCKFEYSNKITKPKVIMQVKYLEKRKNILQQITEISEKRVMIWDKKSESVWNIIELKKAD